MIVIWNVLIMECAITAFVSVNQGGQDKTVNFWMRAVYTIALSMEVASKEYATVILDTKVSVVFFKKHQKGHTRYPLYPVILKDLFLDLWKKIF